MGRHTFPPPPMFDTASAAAFFKHFLDPIEIIVLGLNEAGSYKFPFFGFWLPGLFFNQSNSKDSFLRALREVAPEMELFLENHGQYIKIFVIKLIYIQSCTFRHFTKKLYLEEYV